MKKKIDLNVLRVSLAAFAALSGAATLILSVIMSNNRSLAVIRQRWQKGVGVWHR